MMAVLGEDDSDVSVLKTMLIKLAAKPNVSIRSKAYEGSGDLRRKAARDIRLFQSKGCKWFVVCHDADGPDPNPVRLILQERIIRPLGIGNALCIAIPVQEIESWLIADEGAINRAIPKFCFRGHRNPESISNPKEWLIRESRNSGGRPLYSPRTFNPKIAEHLDLSVVSSKCPSFRALAASLTGWVKSAGGPEV